MSGFFIRRNMEKIIRKQFTIEKATEVGDYLIESIIATETKDREGEVIKLSGMDTSKFMDNPVVMYGHDYGSFPIAKALRLVKRDGKIKALTEFAADIYDKADI